MAFDGVAKEFMTRCDSAFLQVNIKKFGSSTKSERSNGGMGWDLQVSWTFHC